MIRTVLHVSWLALRRDPVALALTFVLPILFFSIFAVVFGGMDDVGRRPLDAVLVVEDEGPLAARLREILLRERGLSLATVDSRGVLIDRARAIELVRRRKVDVAIVLPEGFGTVFTHLEGEPAQLELFADSAKPMAEHLTSGLVQAAVLQLGYESLPRFSSSGSLTRGLPPAIGRAPRPLDLRIENVLADGRDKRPSIAFFTAGIGVMFLLFAVSGRSAILIEERESGVLNRLLSSRLTLDQLLLGRWLFLTGLGSVQVTVMFVWGAMAFGLPLWTARHSSGFVVMTVATAAAAASFGILLATSCKTRAQLSGVSSVVILIMSAIGGSLFPRFLMPEELQRLGLLAFNAWALDGYQKIFWYEAELLELWPQVGVLGLVTIIGLLGARELARRRSCA